MESLKYPLKEGEFVKYCVPKVQCVEKGTYTNSVLVTNQSIYIEKRKNEVTLDGVDMINLSDIVSVEKRTKSNYAFQIVLQLVDESVDLSIKREDEFEYQALCLAIDSQRGENGAFYDMVFFNNIVNEARQKESSLLKKIEKREANREDTFLEKPKSESMKDFEDNLTVFGNNIRETFGMKTKLTNEERQKKEAIEEKKRKKEIHQKALEVLNKRVQEKELSILSEREKMNEQQNCDQTADKQSLLENEQIHLLNQLESLFQAGVLTQEEYEKKKQDIMK